MGFLVTFESSAAALSGVVSGNVAAIEICDEASLEDALASGTELVVSQRDISIMEDSAGLSLSLLCRIVMILKEKHGSSCHFLFVYLLQGVSGSICLKFSNYLTDFTQKFTQHWSKYSKKN